MQIEFMFHSDVPVKTLLSAFSPSPKFPPLSPLLRHAIGRQRGKEAGKKKYKFL